MLILTRKPNETIQIGDDIQIQVLAVDCNQARIGITAPKDIPIDREEIAVAKSKNKAIPKA